VRQVGGRLVVGAQPHGNKRAQHGQPFVDEVI
jgi:hypothetical protein